MKLSALQLNLYFVTDLTFSANKSFDPQKPIEYVESMFTVEPEVTRQEGNGRAWQVRLRIEQTASESNNSPYSFSIVMFGFFQVANHFPEEKEQALVETNAPTMLFGILREVVRDMTMKGPFPGLILPSFSFAPQA